MFSSYSSLNMKWSVMVIWTATDYFKSVISYVRNQQWLTTISIEDASFEDKIHTILTSSQKSLLEVSFADLKTKCKSNYTHCTLQNKYFGRRHKQIHSVLYKTNSWVENISKNINVKDLHFYLKN